MAAEKGNRYAEKHSIEEWEEIFEGIYKRAIKGKYLSLQQAFIESDVRPSTERWLCSKYEVLATIKKDIAAAIANQINKKGLNGNFNPAMSIWRLKQLGEQDKQVIEQNTTTTELTAEERKERIEALKNKM
jgi:hypothetical protein